MNLNKDLVFAGQREVVLVDGLSEFIEQPVGDPDRRRFLAGSYSDPIHGSQVSEDQVGLLDGAFVLIEHDLRARTLTVFTDRFGHYPLYSATRGPTKYVSSSLRAMVARGALSGALDTAGLSDALAFNVPLQQRTLREGATSFSGGRAYTINLDTLAVTVRLTWNPMALLANAHLSFADVKDRLVDLFLEGVRRSTESRARIALTLSGGADSRCLLAASLLTANKSIATYSTGVPGSRAQAYAQAMAHHVGVPHHSHPLDAAFVGQLPSLARQSILLFDGMSFSSEVEASWLRGHLADEDLLLHGAFAELYKIGKMHNFPLDPELAGLSGSAVADNLWQRFASRYQLRLAGLGRDLREALDGQAKSHLANQLAEYQATLDTAGALQMLYIDEFLGKVAKYSRMMWSQRVPVSFPFAYPPLVDLILQVKTTDKISNQFVAYLLKRTNKFLARYPDSNTGAPIGAHRIQRSAIHILDGLRSRLFRSQSRADHQDFPRWLSNMQPPLDEHFATLQASTGLFEPSHISNLIARCRMGDDLAARTLQFLWTLGLWSAEKAPSSA